MKTIQATAKSPEKITDGKFITATTGKPTLRTNSEQYQDDIYTQAAKKQFAQLPKRMKTITASISYCHHTHTKISIGTNFTNCPELTAFIKDQHPLFSNDFPLATAIRVYGKSKTTTERYIAMTAILVKARIIDTTVSGLMLDGEQVDYLKSAFDALVAVINQCLNFKFSLPIDTLHITDDLASDSKRLHLHLKGSAQAIDSATYAAGGTRLLEVSDRATEKLRLEDEISLEQELKKVLVGYNATTSAKYDSNLNRWTRRALNRSDMTDEQIDTAMKILNTHPDNLRTGLVEAILPTVTESLCYDDEASRRNSALVIRHLEYKIELQMACLYKSGFVVEVLAEEAKQDKAMIQYATKTRAVEDKIVAKISVKRSSVLEAMRAKLKGVKVR